ncbi:MAG: glycine betaine ABC transporter substrate-binding protein [Dehalococcoidia bacterium]
MRKLLIICLVLALTVGVGVLVPGCTDEVTDPELTIRTTITDEWDIRPDGREAFEEHYGFTYNRDYLLVVEAGLTLTALKEKEVDVGMVFATDSWMAELGWHVYQDDLSFFPPYDMTPSVRGEVLDEHPEIADILNELVATFPGGGQSATPALVGEAQAIWQELNHMVDFMDMWPDEVATEYLTDHGLIPDPTPDPKGVDITVGSKGFTEQLIVGELMAQVLEAHGFDVTLVDGLSTAALRDGMETGELDVIAEYTGTAWMVHFGEEYVPGWDNNDIYGFVQAGDEDDYNIIWLDPIWNNNTYAFASWPEFVADHDLVTLSDLAALYREMD